jgi:hypothetical protein
MLPIHVAQQQSIRSWLCLNPPSTNGIKGLKGNHPKNATMVIFIALIHNYTYISKIYILTLLTVEFQTVQ